MTWNRADTIGKGAGTPKARGPRVPAEPVQEQVSLDDPENLPSVFEAMSVGAGQGIWGTEHERFSYEAEQQLMRECGFVPERSWAAWKRFVFRDIEAV